MQQLPPQTCLYAEEFKPYIVLAKQVMQGTPAPNLETVQTDCNAYYVKKHGWDGRYHPSDILLSYVVAAENKILLDQRHSDDVYSELSDEPQAFRERNRKTVETILSCLL